MKAKIRRCPICKRYTLKDICVSCNVETKVAHPAKFSPDDPYLLHKIKVLMKTRYSLDVKSHRH